MMPCNAVELVKIDIAPDDKVSFAHCHLWQWEVEDYSKQEVSRVFCTELNAEKMVCYLFTTLHTKIAY